MLNYFAAVVIIGALGIWFHAVYRWWRAHLLHLASSNDLELRRKIAARHFLFVLFALGVPFFAAVLCVARFFPVQYFFLPAAIIAALAPSITWWHRHWPALKALGYGQ